MALWFQKKTEKVESASLQKGEAVKTASVPSALQKPADPPPMPSRSAQRQPLSFKLPKAHEPNTQMSESSFSAASVMQNFLKRPDAAPSAESKTTVSGSEPSAQAVPSGSSLVPAQQQGGSSPEGKLVLKPVEPRGAEPKGEETKPTIRVADKSAIVSEKAEPIAADRPALMRSDPKVLYYQLMNGLYDVVFVLDDNGNIIDCNSRAEEIFGYSSDDVWNIPIDRLVYGMNNRMFNLLRKNLVNKRHILIDVRCFRSNGTSFLAEVGVSAVQLTRSENVVFAIRNVERRKNSAEELRKMHAALDIIPFPAFTCNLHGEFEVLNPPVLKALGMVDEMEAPKKHFGEMLPDMVEFFQAAARGEDVLETRQLTRPDGSSYTMELRLKPMRKGQEITGIAGTMSMI